MRTRLAFASNSGTERLWREHAAEATNRPFGFKPGGLRDLVARWRQRTYFRKELMRLAQDGPHMIDDIGLTMREVEAEIEKPFWQP
jgi:uncharacterized protein YjiS (DUF1127 family)